MILAHLRGDSPSVTAVVETAINRRGHRIIILAEGSFGGAKLEFLFLVGLVFRSPENLEFGEDEITVVWCSSGDVLGQAFIIERIKSNGGEVIEVGLGDNGKSVLSVFAGGKDHAIGFLAELGAYLRFHGLRFHHGPLCFADWIGKPLSVFLL